MRAATAPSRLLPRVAGALPRAARLSSHWRRRLIAACLLLALLGAGYLFWLRNSSLVQVERVTITGLDTPDAGDVREKLTVAAKEMTTLNVDEDALRHAVADESVVQSIVVKPDFPHGLRIEVTENRPVAMLVAGGREVAVAPDGRVLDSVKGESGLPSIHVGALPTSGGRTGSSHARQLVAVAAAAPRRLLPRVSSLSFQSGRGAVAQLHSGPVVIFGHADQLEAKWTAAAGVLARHESEGASYIDVRLPSRPVAGGLDLEHDPQPEAEAAGSGGASDSPGVIAADPGTTPADPTQPQQTDQVPPAAATPATPSTTTTPPQTATTNPQP